MSQVFKGAKQEVGIIDFCPGCKQRAELHSNGQCGDCNKEQAFEDSDPRKKLPPRVDPQKYLVKNQPADQVLADAQVMTPEKERYLEVIKGADPSLVDEIVKDIYEKKILHYDFNQIVQNERWFSLMDLRRMALKIKPDMEKLEAKEEKQMDEKKIIKRKVKK